MFEIEDARAYLKSCKHDRDWYRKGASIGQIIGFVSLIMTVIIFWVDCYLASTHKTGGSIIAGALPGGYIGHCYLRIVQHLAAVHENEWIMVLAYIGTAVMVSMHILLYLKVLNHEDFFGFEILILFEGIASFASIIVTPMEQWEAPFAVLFLATVLRLLLAVAILKTGHCAEYYKWYVSAEMLLWAAEKYGWPENFEIDSLTDKEMEEISLAYIEEKGVDDD